MDSVPAERDAEGWSKRTILGYSSLSLRSSLSRAVVNAYAGTPNHARGVPDDVRIIWKDASKLREYVGTVNGERLTGYAIEKIAQLKNGATKDEEILLVQMCNNVLERMVLSRSTFFIFSPTALCVLQDHGPETAVRMIRQGLLAMGSLRHLKYLVWFNKTVETTASGKQFNTGLLCFLTNLRTGETKSLLAGDYPRELTRIGKVIVNRFHGFLAQLFLGFPMLTLNEAVKERLMIQRAGLSPAWGLLAFLSIMCDGKTLSETNLRKARNKVMAEVFFRRREALSPLPINTLEPGLKHATDYLPRFEELYCRDRLVDKEPAGKVRFGNREFNIEVLSDMSDFCNPEDWEKIEMQSMLPDGPIFSFSVGSALVGKEGHFRTSNRLGMSLEFLTIAELKDFLGCSDEGVLVLLRILPRFAYWAEAHLQYRGTDPSKGYLVGDMMRESMLRTISQCESLERQVAEPHRRIEMWVTQQLDNEARINPETVYADYLRQMHYRLSVFLRKGGFFRSPNCMEKEELAKMQERCAEILESRKGMALVKETIVLLRELCCATERDDKQENEWRRPVAEVRGREEVGANEYEQEAKRMRLTVREDESSDEEEERPGGACQDECCTGQMQYADPGLSVAPNKEPEEYRTEAVERPRSRAATPMPPATSAPMNQEKPENRAATPVPALMDVASGRVVEADVHETRDQKELAKDQEADKWKAGQARAALQDIRWICDDEVPDSEEEDDDDSIQIVGEQKKDSEVEVIEDAGKQDAAGPSAGPLPSADEKKNVRQRLKFEEKEAEAEEMGIPKIGEGYGYVRNGRRYGYGVLERMKTGPERLEPFCDEEVGFRVHIIAQSNRKFFLKFVELTREEMEVRREQEENGHLFDESDGGCPCDSCQGKSSRTCPCDSCQGKNSKTDTTNV